MDVSSVAERVRAAARFRHKRSLLLVALALVAALAVSACGGSSSDSDSGSAGSAGGSTTAASSDTGINLDADRVIADSFAGVVERPPTSGPKAQRGKTVWLLSCLAFEGCQRITNGMVDAGRALGWNVKVVDTKADPNLTISAMRQAVSAGADGIIELPMDCPLLKSGLLAAKSAGVPVVAYGGLDCDHPAFRGGEPLFSANVAFNGRDWGEFYGKTGERDADMVLALAAKQGIEDPKIIQVRNDDQALQHEHSQRFEDEVKAKCPGCTVYPLSFTIPQLGGGKGPSIFKSGVLAHPDANILYYHASAWLPAGLQAAMQGAGRRFDVTCCGDGGQSDLQLIRDGVVDAAGSYPSDWAAFAVFDVMNRVFAGEREFPYEGGSVLYVDRDHNLPAPREYANGSFDYRGAYEKVWNGS
jgi:ribose transport system substrate-binding protein